MTKKIKETKTLQNNGIDNKELIKQNKKDIEDLCNEEGDLKMIEPLSQAEDKLFYFTKIYNIRIDIIFIP